TVTTVARRQVARGKHIDGGRCATAGRPAPRLPEFYSTPIGTDPDPYPRLPLVPSPSGYTTTLAAPSAKGRGQLIRCTVPGSTPTRSAIWRRPGLPGVARAFLMRSSSSGAIRGRPSRFPSLLARARASTDSFLDHGALELGKHTHRLKHRLARRRRRVEPL